jgi:Na+-transporting methylmalonyl-CoA/oxaloacetate decarboxylase gamma subunit
VPVVLIVLIVLIAVVGTVTAAIPLFVTPEV